MVSLGRTTPAPAPPRRRVLGGGSMIDHKPPRTARIGLTLPALKKTVHAASGVTWLVLDDQ
jgi:hypothetical protein